MCPAVGPALRNRRGAGRQRLAGGPHQGCKRARRLLPTPLCSAPSHRVLSTHRAYERRWTCSACLVIQHEIMPRLLHDALERHFVRERDACDGTVPVSVEPCEGLHHATVPLVVAPKGQGFEQGGHHAPVVVAGGGARHQPDLPCMILVCASLADQVIEPAPHSPPDRAVRGVGFLFRYP